MLKIKQSPKLPAEERKLQLLTSAQKLFAKKGFKETTTQEIAKNAGLTKGALYFHFPSKEDILYELVKHVSSDFQKAVDDNFDKLKSPNDYLKLFMAHHCGCEGHNDLIHNLDFWVQAMSIPKIKKYLNRKFRELLVKFVNSIDPKYGRTKKERMQLGVFTFSLFDGLMVRQVLDYSVIDEKSQFKLFDKMLHGGLGGK